MPEPFSAEQLNQLRQRWERDPKSRAFLQLAEEYRRAARLDDAILVLRAGLKEQPNYLSAQVALGRCLVETGDAAAAIDILERAVARDPTQLVANKLLVEAYLATGQASRARERLDLYRLFNDRDAEIELLDARIGALERPAVEAPATPRGTPRPISGAALFELPAIADLPVMRLEPAAVPARRDAARRDEPFGSLLLPGAVRQIDEAFADQGIFALAPAAPAPVELAQDAPVDWESASWPVGSALLEPMPEPAPLASLAPTPASPEPPAAPPDEVETRFEAESAPAPEPEPFRTPPATVVQPEFAPLPEALEASMPAAPPSRAESAPRAASATLGELYLSQGHLNEAEESFLSVLEARPGDSAAMAGLESVRLQRGDESGAFSEGEVVAAEESNVIVGGLTARKAALLRDFLARIRRGAQRHVS